MNKVAQVNACMHRTLGLGDMKGTIIRLACVLTVLTSWRYAEKTPHEADRSGRARLRHHRLFHDPHGLARDIHRLHEHDGAAPVGGVTRASRTWGRGR
jgi:hypothetical protein